MSSTQSKTFSFDENNMSTFVASADSGVEIQVYVSALDSKVALRTESSSIRKISLNDAAKALMYPNTTAHPISADIFSRAFGSYAIFGNYARGYYYFDEVNVFEWAFKATITGYRDDKNSSNNTNSAILNSTLSSSIKIGMSASNGSGGHIRGHITLYFTRYDFSAVAGDGVTSASVSSSTGYTGDTVTCSCVIPAGYVFDGWYDEEGGFRASTTSFVYTVGTRDHTFTAKAHQDTHNVNGTYNGSTKAILTGITGDVSVSYNGRSVTLNTSAQGHTLACAGKVMRGNVSVGGTSLATGGKIMRSNLVLNYV